MKDFKVYQASGYLTKLVTDASDVRKMYDEISGSLVEFDTPISAPLAELIVDINPVQDLHGQDAPYPAGGGKNKFNIDRTAGTLIGGTPESRREFELDKYYVGLTANNYYGSSSINSYSVSNNTVTVNAKNRPYGIAFPLSVTVGTNYCVSFTQAENQEFRIGYYDSNGDYLSSTGAYNSSGYFTPPANTATAVIVFTSTLNGLESDVSYSNIQVEIGTSATPYSPYSNICPITGWTGVNIYHSGEDTSNPNVYTVLWQDEAGTVYGGTLEVVSGRLTSEWETATFDGSNDENWSLWGGAFVTYGTTPNIANSDTVSQTNIIVMADRFKAGGVNYRGVQGQGEIIKVVGENSYIAVDPTNFADVNEFKAYLANNPMQIIYKLATPIEIQLTPQEIITLVGVNNIWADTGDVSVKYRTH